MVRLLSEALRVADLTGGVFDPTVQPLWLFYQSHFEVADADPNGPAQGAVDEALSRVGRQHLRVAPDRILLARRGMAVTLNGIAQGYVTDRVVDLLRAGGVAQTLVDLGEARAVGAHSSGRPWRATLDDPSAPVNFRA